MIVHKSNFTPFISANEDKRKRWIENSNWEMSNYRIKVIVPFFVMVLPW
jgi:hypothetical protein